MAVDEALLDDAAEHDTASLRFYQWREPTLSLGYFQSYGDRQSHLASLGAAVVRRLSGGGALLHDRELTYALCLPAAHEMSRESRRLYGVVHCALIAVMEAWGVVPSLQGEGDATSQEADESFLCFSRRSSADVVLPGGGTPSSTAKIVGSAQRRRRGAVLQHGSVLINMSPFAPEFAGINELSGVSLTCDWLLTAWQVALATALKLHLRPQRVEGQLRESAQRLQSGKYGQASWTERR